MVIIQEEANKFYQHYWVSYSGRKDSYSAWYYTGPKKDPDWDDFKFEFESKCIKIRIGGENGWEERFISAKLLNRISFATRTGWKVRFIDRPE